MQLLKGMTQMVLRSLAGNLLCYDLQFIKLVDLKGYANI